MCGVSVMRHPAESSNETTLSLGKKRSGTRLDRTSPSAGVFYGISFGRLCRIPHNAQCVSGEGVGVSWLVNHIIYR